MTDWRIGDDVEVEWSKDGWPHWTRVKVRGEQVLLLDHDEARDLAYVLQRITRKIDDVEAIDLENRKRHL